MNRLRELRLQRGLTLKELAKHLGVDYSTLGHIERGRRGFSMDSLKWACEFFGVSADYLLGSDAQTMLDDFISSIRRTFFVTRMSADGEVTEGLSATVPGLLAMKLHTISMLAEIDSPVAIARICEIVKLEQAKEDFN